MIRDPIPIGIHQKHHRTPRINLLHQHIPGHAATCSVISRGFNRHLRVIPMEVMAERIPHLSRPAPPIRIAQRTSGRAQVISHTVIGMRSSPGREVIVRLHTPEVINRQRVIFKMLLRTGWTRRTTVPSRSNHLANRRSLRPRTARDQIIIPFRVIIPHHHSHCSGTTAMPPVISRRVQHHLAFRLLWQRHSLLFIPQQHLQRWIWPRGTLLRFHIPVRILPGSAKIALRRRMPKHQPHHQQPHHPAQQPLIQRINILEKTLTLIIQE